MYVIQNEYYEMPHSALSVIKSKPYPDGTQSFNIKDWVKNIDDDMSLLKTFQPRRHHHRRCFV